jgi:hypothetical protein
LGSLASPHSRVVAASLLLGDYGCEHTFQPLDPLRIPRSHC